MIEKADIRSLCTRAVRSMKLERARLWYEAEKNNFKPLARETIV